MYEKYIRHVLNILYADSKSYIFVIVIVSTFGQFLANILPKFPFNHIYDYVMFSVNVLVPYYKNRPH